jgi:two-component system chemotaxis response regulator CheB
VAPIRILIADDSAFLRLMYTRRLGADPDLAVIGAARDGNEAVELAAALQPDVITLDVEMPGRDGLSALSQIMAQRPTPVIMVSSLTSEGAETTVAALTLGAVDFVAKPTQISGNQGMIGELITKIKLAANVRPGRPVHQAQWAEHMPDGGGSPRQPLPSRRLETGLGALREPANGRLPAPGSSGGKSASRPLGNRDPIIMIGSSTGGPAALRQLMAALPADLNAAGVIVQHMPAGFTASLARRLDEGSAWHVSEAVAGDRLMRNRFLIAPGGYHLVFDRDASARLTQTPPVHAVRPAVDVTLRSLAELYADRVCAVILTGMGRDGTEAALLVRQRGGRVVVEAESTCAVYGMPRSVVEANAADHVLPLPEIAGFLARLMRR